MARIGLIAPGKFARSGGRKAGFYYLADATGSASTLTLVASTEVATALVWDGAAIDRIGINVSTLAAASVIRLGVRADEAGIPGAVLLDAGTIDSSTTGYKEITVALVLPRGNYFVTCTAQGGGPIVSASVATPSAAIGSTSTGNLIAGNLGGYSQTGVAGALPGTFTVVDNGGTVPRILVRAA